MKRLTTLIAVIAVTFALADCRGREKSADGATETIAPAQPKPGDTGTDAMTQTVDIEDSRSEADGASLTTAPSTTTTETTATAATTTVPVKPPKKQ